MDDSQVALPGLPGFIALRHRTDFRTMDKLTVLITAVLTLLLQTVCVLAEEDVKDREFFERKIRPLLVQHCYECHSEAAEERQGGLLLDRRSGWIEGGDTSMVVIPGEPDQSLLIKAVRYADKKLQMPPEKQLPGDSVKLLEQWVRRGAPGPKDDPGTTEFSRLGDQKYLFSQAEQHWAFQPVKAVSPPEANLKTWNINAIDQFVFAGLSESGLTPSSPASPSTLIRRLTYDLTGLPPTMDTVKQFVENVKQDRHTTIAEAVDRLIESPAFGEHFARLWLDVARYADTDSAYRPDTRTPHYFPFAFTYRDYVVDSFNKDKPFDDFVREQFAADLIGFKAGDPELAALGFLAAGPFANRDPLE